MMREWANNHIIRVNMVFLVRMMASVDVCLSISFYVRCIYCLMCIELLGQFTLFSLFFSFFFLFLFLSITHSFARRVPKTKDTYLDAEAGRNLSAHLVFVRFICLFRCYHLYCNIQYYVIICCNLSFDGILDWILQHLSYRFDHFANGQNNLYEWNKYIHISNKRHICRSHQFCRWLYWPCRKNGPITFVNCRK